jgi:NAD(P)-dependent dehydrogenase (short-subunit alcohol dehydrogenase family)
MLLTGASRGIGHATVMQFAMAGWRILSCSRQAFSDKCPWPSGRMTMSRSIWPTRSTPSAASARSGAGLRSRVASSTRWSTMPASRQRAGRLAARRGGYLVQRLEPGVPGQLLRADHAGAGLFKELKAGNGAIVNVTSIAGTQVHPFAGAAYATSKAALASLTREMASDFGPHGIRVNSISPGEIDTSILSPGTDKIVEKLPMRRLGTTDEVAKAIYFLCTSASSYVTGAELHINGGQHV